MLLLVPASPAWAYPAFRAKGRLFIRPAAKGGAVVISKDHDFVDLQLRLGPPPPIIWLTCGNTSEARLQQIFTHHFAAARALLETGASLVEITGPWDASMGSMEHAKS